MLYRSLVAVLAALVALAAACSGGEATRKSDGAEQGALTEAAAQEQPAAGADSDLLPTADSPVRGPMDAPVTIVVFSEFQCPFCARAAATLEALMDKEEYQGKVRLVFKHFPLPFHKQARPAARAALAAGEQGKFWQMHDLLFENQRDFRGQQAAEMKELAAHYATKLDLDLEQFRRDFDREQYEAMIDRDHKLGQEVGVRGTPNMYINGAVVRGALPLEHIERVVDKQLAEAARLRKEGVSDDEIYRTLVARNLEEAKQPQPEAKPEPSAPERVVEMIPVDADDAVRGGDEPLVTIVEFSDFQCPFCARANATIDKIVNTYGDKVRVVFKHNPLPFHKQADPAARLAMAAQEKGEFWQMHDLLFENQGRLKEEGIFVELGEEIGLSKEEVAKALHSDDFADRIKNDQKRARMVDARGTPTFFINGVKLVGAQPFAKFEALIDEQLDIARELAESKDSSGDELYEQAVAHNKENTPEPAEPNPSAEPTVDTSKLSIDADQTRGPADAKVTVFIFSDFQCPYCSRGAANLEEALETIDEPVRLVFKHYPLPFHKQAKAAARAAMAAGEQGKFWQMHDLLFENQKRLQKDGIFVELAQQLGLDIETFEADMKKDAFDDQITADMSEGGAVGVRGTPAFFINGTAVSGAQPAHKFEQVIEDALAEKQ